MTYLRLEWVPVSDNIIDEVSGLGQVNKHHAQEIVLVTRILIINGQPHFGEIQLLH